jgi:hypothetical protein
MHSKAVQILFSVLFVVCLSLTTSPVLLQQQDANSVPYLQLTKPQHVLEDAQSWD